jgi:hypothetical protein
MLSIQMVSIECERAIGDERDATEMLRKAFAEAKHHWMVLEPDPQLKGALNAVLTKMGDEHPDKARLETEIRLLQAMNAFLAAAQAGLSPSIPEVPEGYEPIGVVKLWKEAA